MRARAAMLLALGAVPGAGCEAIDDFGAFQLPHQPAADSDVPPASTPVKTLTPGQPTIVAVGNHVGYGIAASIATPRTFRVVWVGDAAHARFWGSVWTPGHFTRTLPGCAGACPLEAHDWVSSPQPVARGERIDFDTRAVEDIDGMDVVADAEPIYFDLFVDGTRVPSLVFYPSDLVGTNTSPPAVPFALHAP